MKIVEGSEERYVNRDEPIPADLGVDLKVPPRGIGARAAKVWRQLAPDMIDKHVLTAWDVPLFTAFCRITAHIEVLEAKVRRRNPDYSPVDGYTGVGSQGQLVKVPYWSQLIDAYNQQAKLATRFGLSPADRAGIVLNAGAEGKPTMGAERLLS